MFWGISESFDLYEEYLSANKDSKESPAGDQDHGENAASTSSGKFNAPSVLNILLFGAGDPRHILHTIAKLYTHQNASNAGGDTTISLNFYMLDGCIEIVARNIALLSIALESNECLNLRCKVHLFMDIYGNAIIRPASHHYLVSKARTLLKMVVDDEYREQLAPFLNINSLKYRERDGLQDSLNFWVPKQTHVFDMPDYWMGRVRQLLGTRYDHREGVFDWDLNMTLKYRNAKQICSQEYRYWRETGIAFTYPEYEQCKSNKTLSMGLVRHGEKYMHRGYVGDIQVGPFCGFGLRVSDERYSRSVHGENDYRATDVTEHNLLELFHEIKERTAYHHDKHSARKYGAVKLQMGNRFICNECDTEGMQKYDKPWIPCEGVKVHFLSADEVFGLRDDVPERWRNFFDVVFVGHNYFNFLKSSFSAVLRPNALLILETKWLTLARKEELTKFDANLKKFAQSANLSNQLNYNAINAKFSVFKFRKGTEDASC